VSHSKGQYSLSGSQRMGFLQSVEVKSGHKVLSGFPLHKGCAVARKGSSTQIANTPITFSVPHERVVLHDHNRTGTAPAPSSPIPSLVPGETAVSLCMLGDFVVQI
jgi:hypothetical protein